MTIRAKSAILVGIMGVSALVLSGCTPTNSLRPYGKTNHFGHKINPYQAANLGGGRYSPRHPRTQRPKKYKNFIHHLRGQKHIAYQVPAPHPGMGQFQHWVDYEPQYKLFPGDQLDIVIPSAPELSRTLTVGPDGRISMPMAAPIMAAGRTLPHVQQLIQGELAKQLRDPTTAVTPRAFAPAQIYVGGDVGAPGTYTTPGPIGALEAIIMAGGMRPTSNAKQVAVLRRAPNGGMMMRSVNIANGLRNIREYNDNMQLRRGDIIFVPRSTIGEVGVFMQNLRNAIPIDFNVSYQFGQGGGTDPAILNDGATTTITP